MHQHHRGVPTAMGREEKRAGQARAVTRSEADLLGPVSRQAAQRLFGAVEPDGNPRPRLSVSLWQQADPESLGTSAVNAWTSDEVGVGQVVQKAGAPGRQFQVIQGGAVAAA